jgi:hypothetical protein
MELLFEYKKKVLKKYQNFVCSHKHKTDKFGGKKGYIFTVLTASQKGFHFDLLL